MNTAIATRDWLEDPLTLFTLACVPLVAMATVALWFADRPYGVLRWKLACVSALTSAGLALLANQALAHLWERPRPYAAHPAVVHLLTARSPDPSFPSDHAAAAIAIAVAVIAFSRLAGGVLLAVAALIAFSRVAAGAHYPGDVLAGALVGTVSALVVLGPGRPWVIRVVTLASRVSDPVVARARRVIHTPIR